jgi:hypothetical protein
MSSPRDWSSIPGSEGLILQSDIAVSKAELAELKKQSGLTPERISPLTIKRPPSRGTSNRRDNR